MEFIAEIVIKKESRAGLVFLHDMGTNILNLRIDTPDFDSALSELDGTCKQVLAGHLQYEVDLTRGDKQPYTTHITVSGLIAGLRFYHTFQLTDELYKELRAKKQTEQEKPKLNEESLQNDIQYGVDMIRSVTPDLKKNINMIGVVNWQWHILNKHFGLVIPTEIKDLQANFGKDKS